MNYLRIIYFWFLDYVYVLRMQVKSLKPDKAIEQFRNSSGSPILVIPGIYENWRFMLPVAKKLFDAGYDVHVVKGLGYNRGTIEHMAELVDEYVTSHSLSNIQIVAHSKGGLIGKFLLLHSKSTTRYKNVIAINTPYSGSRYALFFPLKSIRLFSPKSSIVLALAKEKEANCRITSIYGVFDPHIPTGSFLDGATNIQLENYGHFRILALATVHEAILNALKE